jgi:RimJ/RimL family protein N-acetyltransferase
LADAALDSPGIFQVQATCDTENIPSQRTLEKSGFTREGGWCCHDLRRIRGGQLDVLDASATSHREGKFTPTIWT